MAATQVNIKPFTEARMPSAVAGRSSPIFLAGDPPQILHPLAPWAPSVTNAPAATSAPVSTTALLAGMDRRAYPRSYRCTVCNRE